MTEKELMQLAIELAKRGKDRTFPNPNVGALIIKNGEIISEGYHQFFGDRHAEIHALNQAGAEAKDATLIVTLEPCSHYGKTPPCVDAIINSGIKEVIVGLKDPNPLVNGKGIEILKRAGLKVKAGVLQDELKNFYKDYAKRFSKKKSYVVLKYAMTLDGKIATSTGDSKWISSEKSREWVHNFRTRFDGILVGVKTIIRDNPQLTSHGKGKNPVRIILDPELEIPLSSIVLMMSIQRLSFIQNIIKRKYQKFATEISF